MKAIKTKFLGPTNHRGARVVATDTDTNKITIDWDHELDAEENHREAARALIAEMNWFGAWVSGSLLDGYVHVCLKRSQGSYLQWFADQDRCRCGKPVKYNAAMAFEFCSEKCKKEASK